MKIRKGFVSNSSTTSFCIYGICIEDDLIQKACDLNKIKCDVSSDDYSRYDKCDELAEVMGLEYHSGPDGEGAYFGKSLSSMKDEETFGQFKKSIEDKLSKIFGEEITCSVMEEAWRDG